MTLATSLNKAQRLERDSKLEDAAKVYSEVLSRFPKNARARKSYEALLSKMQKEQDPPVDVQLKIKQQFDGGSHADTASTCASLLNNYRRSHFLWDVLGRSHLKLGHLDEAATCLNKACELNPRSPGTLAGMADVCRAQGRLEAASGLYQKALSIDPNHLAALNNYANLLKEGNRLHEAAPLLEKAVQQAPENPQLLYNFANLLRQLGNSQRARELYAKASDLEPKLIDAKFNLAQMQTAEGNPEDAIKNYEAVLKSNPQDDRSRAQKLHAMAQLNDWRWIDEYQEHRRHLGLRGTSCAPFVMMTLEDNPDLLRVRTQAYANEKFPIAPTPLPPRGTSRPARLRIGYFSADFQDHATMHLMAGLFEHHNASRFEIFAYSYGAATADETRNRVSQAVNHFKDVSNLSSPDLVKLAQADNLDIAIDLKGYTGDNRTDLFKERLAPLHMSYLGYPGTMGTTAFDYFVGDSVTCPAGSERYFDEHLIRLPNSYQVNDNTREISPRQFTRRECGLPDDGFVFCCFNNSYKITPREFDIWMDLLKETPDSVLWLLDTGEVSKANLQQEAEARGVSPERLVFAPRMPLADHLARHRVADLFLDTFAVNAHTTASDALWAGLPVLTLPGQQFSARVGASLVSAVGLPEMIARSETDYKARALDLASDLDKLANLRVKLQRNRLSAPLFDTQLFARHLENAFDLAFERQLQGLLPDHLAVPAVVSGPPSGNGRQRSKAA